MISPIIQADDALRIRALAEYGIANTPPERAFSDLAKLAQQICKTEVALVTFIDQDMQWFKAYEGTDIDRNTREHAICSHCITRPDHLMYIPDLTLDSILKNNPMVTGPTNIRFYAGLPLLSREGYAIGTLCVMHTSPKTLSDEQKASLEILRNQIMHLLEGRRANAKLKKRESILEELNDHLSRFASTVTHDIKNPLSNMRAIAEHLSQECAEKMNEEDKKALKYIEESAVRLTDMTEGILAYYRNDHLNRKFESLDLKNHLEELACMLCEGHKVSFKIPETGIVRVNKAGINQVFSNLINNAMRFNDKEQCTIDVQFSNEGESYLFTFKDNGIGIEKKDLPIIFDEFKTLEHEKSGTGLGLSSVKRVIKDLGGTIEAHSTPGKGTSFTFSMKVPQ